MSDPGSFRDPDSRVVHRDGRVLRELSPAGVAGWEAFAASSLAGDPRVIGTRQVGPALLEHDRVPFWTYPYEWPFALLREAALLQLDLLADAVAEGLSLKDASPYNVQWVGGRPVFVDVGSFEVLRPGEPWAAYRQFCCVYLYPLLLTAYRGVPFQPLLRGSLEGIDPEAASRLLPRWRRGVTVNARLLARLERRTAPTGRETSGRLARAGYKPELLLAQVRRLRRLVARLRWQPESEWTAYERPPDDLAAKSAFVARAAARVQPALAWDLGANDGAFARVVAEHAGLVVAMDADPAVAERLAHTGVSAGGRHSVPQHSQSKVLPLVMDVCDPSPARGWALRERAALTDRGRPDLTLSLALVHHLAITRTIPPPLILDWLHSLGGTHVIEVPQRTDPMVQLLLSAKRNDFPYDPGAFERAIHDRFEVVERLELATRVLYEVR